MRFFDKKLCRYLTKKEETYIIENCGHRALQNFALAPTLKELVIMRQNEVKERLKNAEEKSNKDSSANSGNAVGKYRYGQDYML